MAWGLGLRVRGFVVARFYGRHRATRMLHPTLLVHPAPHRMMFGWQVAFTYYSMQNAGLKIHCTQVRMGSNPQVKPKA